MHRPMEVVRVASRCAVVALLGYVAVRSVQSFRRNTVTISITEVVKLDGRGGDRFVDLATPVEGEIRCETYTMCSYRFLLKLNAQMNAVALLESMLTSNRHAVRSRNRVTQGAVAEPPASFPGSGAAAGRGHAERDLVTVHVTESADLVDSWGCAHHGGLPFTPACVGDEVLISYDSVVSDQLTIPVRVRECYFQPDDLPHSHRISFDVYFYAPVDGVKIRIALPSRHCDVLAVHTAGLGSVARLHPGGFRSGDGSSRRQQRGRRRRRPLHYVWKIGSVTPTTWTTIRRGGVDVHPDAPLATRGAVQAPGSTTSLGSPWSSGAAVSVSASSSLTAPLPAATTAGPAGRRGEAAASASRSSRAFARAASGSNFSTTMGEVAFENTYHLPEGVGSALGSTAFTDFDDAQSSLVHMGEPGGATIASMAAAGLEDNAYLLKASFFLVYEEWPRGTGDGDDDDDEVDLVGSNPHAGDADDEDEDEDEDDVVGAGWDEGSSDDGRGAAAGHSGASRRAGQSRQGAKAEARAARRKAQRDKARQRLAAGRNGGGASAGGGKGHRAGSGRVPALLLSYAAGGTATGVAIKRLQTLRETRNWAPQSLLDRLLGLLVPSVAHLRLQKLAHCTTWFIQPLHLVSL